MRLSASVVMLSAALSAALTREQVVNPLISIATKSNALIPKVKQVNAINTPLRIIGQGPWPSILTGLDEIITTEKTLALVLDDQEPYFPGFNIAYAVQAFSDDLCERQRDLLMNLTEKANTILDVSLVVEKEVSEKLRSTEGYIDAIFDWLEIAAMDRNLAADLRLGYFRWDLAMKAALTTYGF